MPDKALMNQIICPRCGQRAPLFFSGKARCSGLFALCKGRGCRCIFELVVDERGQYRTKERMTREREDLKEAGNLRRQIH